MTSCRRGSSSSKVLLPLLSMSLLLVAAAVAVARATGTREKTSSGSIATVVVTEEEEEDVKRAPVVAVETSTPLARTAEIQRKFGKTRQRTRKKPSGSTPAALTKLSSEENRSRKDELSREKKKSKTRSTTRVDLGSTLKPVTSNIATLNTATSTSTSAPGRGSGADFTFVNVTIKRRLTGSGELSMVFCFVWPSSSLPPSWIATRTPARNFSIDVHIGRVDGPRPDAINFEIRVPLDEWIRVGIERPFFVYNARYYIQLHNNDISRRSEYREFSTPTCRNPSQDMRTCLDAKGEPLAIREDKAGSYPRPRIVCLTMDKTGLDNHEIRFRVDWKLKRGQFLNLTNATSVGMEKIEDYLQAQSSGNTTSAVTVFSAGRKVVVGQYLVKNTSIDLDLAADDEFVLEVSTKYEEWTVVYEAVRLRTKIEALRRRLSEGSLKFCPQASQPLTREERNVIIALIVAVLIMISMVGACFVLGWKKCRDIQMNKTVMTKENSYKSSSVNLLRESVSTCGSVTDEWEIEANDLELGKEVGQGAFGKVVCGFYKKQRVAVKVLKDDIHSLYREDLLREIALLKSLGTHQSIVSILGASTLKEPLALVMEYMPYGNLYNFLRRCRSNFDWRHESRELVSIQCMHDETSGEKEVWEISAKDLISWARQVAVAMEYLASKQYVHRDLAARNILLGSNKTIKLCDFGLARLIYRGDGHYFRKTNTKLPIKWMALESIRDRVYTSRSDVWSFGILLWEIATFGSCPYPSITLEDLPRYLEEGYRMPQPNNCSDELYLMMMECWRSNPEDRPTFAELRKQLEDMLSRDVDYLDLEVGDGESPFSVSRMPDNENNDNSDDNSDDDDDNNNNENKSNNRKTDDSERAPSSGDNGERSSGSPPPLPNQSQGGTPKKPAGEGKGDMEGGKNPSLPRLVKSKEVAIDKALGRTAAGKGFAGKIADNVFYHKSVLHDPKRSKKMKKEEEEEEEEEKEKEKEEEDKEEQEEPNLRASVKVTGYDALLQRSPLKQEARQTRLRHHRQPLRHHHHHRNQHQRQHQQPNIPTIITTTNISVINSDSTSESFPLLQFSPPSTSPVDSNFRLLDTSAAVTVDRCDLESVGSSDRSPSGDTEDTKSSWMLDII